MGGDETYPEKGTEEYKAYLAKLKILEGIRLKKLKALELLCNLNSYLNPT